MTLNYSHLSVENNYNQYLLLIPLKCRFERLTQIKTLEFKNNVMINENFQIQNDIIRYCKYLFII